MRILFICPFVPWPLESGGKIRTFHLIKQAAAHAEIHLRLIREPDDVPDAAEALAPHCASLQVFDRARPGTLARWMRPKLERWFHSPRLFEAVRQELEREEFHLVHLDELLLARVLPPGRRVPVVQHHHKLDTVLYDHLRAGEGPQRFFDLWKLRRLEAESARRYRHHLLCSHGDAEIQRARYGALDCHFVPSGFDPEQFRPSTPPRERQPDRLVFLGSMDYGPNVDAVEHFVAHVLPLVRARRPGVVLEVVGGAPPPPIQALASDHVRITGRVPDVRPYHESAAALVVPLRIGGGTRLKIVEALALATPVVSTAVGAEGLGLQEGRDLLLADGPRALAQAVTGLLERPDRARALGEHGRATVHERFRWEALAGELVDYWERVAFSGALSPSR